MSLAFNAVLVCISVEHNKDFNLVKKIYLYFYKERLFVCRLLLSAFAQRNFKMLTFFTYFQDNNILLGIETDVISPVKFTYLLLYRSLWLWHLVWCLSLYVDCWWHLLLKWCWKWSRSQGYALGLDLHLDLGLSWRFHYLWLLLRNLQCSWERRHGDIHRLQPPWELWWRCMQTCCVLHRRAFRWVVLLLTLFLSSQLYGLRSGRHSTYKVKGNNSDEIKRFNAFC